MKLRSGIYVDPESGWVLFPESVSILCRLNDQLVLVRQPRPKSDEFTLELPGGRMEKEEGIIEAAQRELSEEAGLKGGQANLLLSLDLDLSSSFHRTHLVQIHNAEETNKAYEFERYLVNEDKARSLVTDGMITHAPTVVAILGFLGGYGS